jgi:two-component sensor histidine kinase
VKFLARILDRLSWPVLVVAGVVLLALAAYLSMSALQIETPIRQMVKIVDIVKPATPDSVTPPESDPASQVASSKTPQAVREKSPTEPPQPPDASSMLSSPDHPMVMAPIPQDLQARIRKRVHDELARVQHELLQAQKDALSGHEEQRRDAEQSIKDAEQQYAATQHEIDGNMREAEKNYADRRRDLLAQMKELQKPNKPRDTDPEARANNGCLFQNGVLRCQFNQDKEAAKELANRLRDLEHAQRDALKEVENKRRDAVRELHEAQAAAQRSIDAARQEIATQIAIIGDSKTYKVPTIKIPDLKLPDIVLTPAPAVSHPPHKAPAAPIAPVPPVAPAPVVIAAPAAPLSKDTMMLVERDVGSAVADTVGEEVHTAVKGYRLAVSGMLIGIALLLFSGAVIGKTVMTSNRAARARADLLRVEAERNLMSRQVVQAQLKMMQAQVEPHFLFNTLANVRFLQESDPAGAGTMLDHLIDYLHAALPQMRESSTTLARETELARAYLEILRIRMGARLDFAIHVPEALQVASFPPMMLLSLVENAIKHGLEPMREGGRIDIEAAKVDGRLRLAVKDTGTGLNAEAAAETGSGVGLANIRERLKTLYGEGARLVLQENQPRGMIAAIEIPYVETDHRSAG